MVINGVAFTERQLRRAFDSNDYFIVQSYVFSDEIAVQNRFYVMPR
jgi:hypothetical protein